MKKLYLYFAIFSIFSVFSSAESFKYEKNLIACQHHFTSCNLSLIKESDKSNIDVVQIELDRKILLEEQRKTLLANSSGKLAPGTYKTPNSTSNNVSRICAENGSCYGDISVNTGRPKTVAVKGYYRSDGTYVRGHYRSKPKSKD